MFVYYLVWGKIRGGRGRLM